mmetsp:Transcript_43039/g.131047  ORF Transcript_43039/g.131047 Transcript_43039/m.131047 type:complete len:221 (+) Transcript_43039:1802-2464(+)
MSISPDAARNARVIPRRPVVSIVAAGMFITLLKPKPLRSSLSDRRDKYPCTMAAARPFLSGIPGLRPPLLGEVAALNFFTFLSSSLRTRSLSRARFLRRFSSSFNSFLYSVIRSLSTFFSCAFFFFTSALALFSRLAFFLAFSASSFFLAVFLDSSRCFFRAAPRCLAFFRPVRLKSRRPSVERSSVISSSMARASTSPLSSSEPSSSASSSLSQSISKE